MHNRTTNLYSSPLNTHSLLAMILAIGVSGAVTAGETTHRQQSAHVHGVAHLNVVAEGAEVRCELVSPAATLVGFEHAPKTSAERETLNLAKANLDAGDGMIRFNTQAGCRLVTAKVDTDIGNQIRRRHQTPGAGGHADITASYRFNCDRPDRLDSAALGLFIGFPALRRVLVQYMTKDGQGGAELTPVNTVVTFVPLIAGSNRR